MLHAAVGRAQFIPAVGGVATRARLARFLRVRGEGGVAHGRRVLGPAGRVLELRVGRLNSRGACEQVGEEGVRGPHPASRAATTPGTFFSALAGRERRRGSRQLELAQ
jgi:hypothetical protein